MREPQSASNVPLARRGSPRVRATMPLFVERGHSRGVSYLGEKRCPDRLDFGDVSSLDERVELVGLEQSNRSQPIDLLHKFSLAQAPCCYPQVGHASQPARYRGEAMRKEMDCSGRVFDPYSDLDVVIGEDERRVRRCKLCGGHCECGCVVETQECCRDSDREEMWFVVGLSKPKAKIFSRIGEN